MSGKSHLRFERLAPYYDAGVKAMGLMLGGEAAVRHKVLRLLPVAEGNRILEVGCGTGTVSLMAARLVGETGSVVGLDPSPGMLQRAHQKLLKRPLSRLEFRLGAGAPLPFGADSFDAVIFFLVLHEMAHADRIDSLKEALRVLKPGGHLLVAELDRPHGAFASLILRLLLLVEEEEASDFLGRGLQGVVTEACGKKLTELTRVSFAWGLGQGVLYGNTRSND